MKYILVLIAVLSLSDLNSQTKTPTEIAINCYKFLEKQDHIKFENNATMDHEMDSLHLTENYFSTMKISNHKKVNLKVSDGVKAAIINYNGSNLTIVNLNDGFYTQHQFDGDIEKLGEFAKDSLDYDFPLLNLFKKEGWKIFETLKVRSFYVGKKLFKGQLVHHLAFYVEDFSWQMFVSADKSRPVPYKIIINDLKDRTQYSAELSNWDFSVLDPKSYSLLTDALTRINAIK